MTRDNWSFPFSTSTCDKVNLSSPCGNPQPAFSNGPASSPAPVRGLRGAAVEDDRGVLASFLAAQVVNGVTQVPAPFRLRQV